LFKAAFLSAAHFESDPTIIMEKVNQVLYQYLQPDLFIAAIVISIDLNEGIMNSVNAGLDPPVLVRDKDEDVLRLESGGMLIGVEKNSVYKSDEIALKPGDTVCVFTDGITEARNREKQEFGDHTVASIIVSGVRIKLPSEKIVANIVQRVLAHTHGVPRRDDMTMMMIKYLPEAK
jgi:sigma-B regulation protein RsbU (phosphoserine phosphatase)